MALQLLLLLGVATLGSILSLGSTWSATSVWRVRSKVNEFLGVQSHHEGWDGHNLGAHGNVSLLDQHSGVVDRSGKTQLEDLGLQSSLQEVLGLQGQDVIQLHLVLWQNTDSHQSSDQSVTFKQTLLVLLVSGQQVSGSTANLRELEVDSVDLVLVLQSVLSSQLQLSVQTDRLVWALRHRVSFGVSSWST